MPWNGSKWVSDTEGWWSQAQKPAAWRCKLCSCQVCHKGKACPQCGARKAWAAGAAAATTPTTPTSASAVTTGTSVASQLAQVATLLHAAPTATMEPPAQPAQALDGITRADLSAKIKDL